jgi:hypothetical protein
MRVYACREQLKQGRSKMSKFAIILVAMGLAVCGSALGTTWDIQNAPSDDEIPISADIDAYAQIIWQDTDIVFNNNTGATGDWQNDTLTGAYDVSTTSSLDPWASDYYESRDGAHFYVNSNTDITMTAVCSGNLEAGGHEIPTWFTLAASGHYDNGFLIGSEWLNNGPPDIPLNGAGAYADDDNDDTVMELDSGSSHYPDQYPFPMEVSGTPRTYTLDLPGVTRGTLEFKARIDRTGMGEWEEEDGDPAGEYKADIKVTFAETS